VTRLTESGIRRMVVQLYGCSKHKLARGFPCPGATDGACTDRLMAAAAAAETRYAPKAARR
jgi:hypothetical protein